MFTILMYTWSVPCVSIQLTLSQCTPRTYTPTSKQANKKRNKEASKLVSQKLKTHKYLNDVHSFLIGWLLEYMYSVTPTTYTLTTHTLTISS